ncbi:MAG: ABC1 kinase family protein [Vicinamibacterales bacterium]
MALTPVRALRRATRVMWVSLWYAGRFLSSRSRRPQVLRAYLQTLDGAFLKLGQVLAMRYDMLPASYCEELSGLLDRLPPVAYRDIEAIIERDLGRPCADLFASIDPVPVSTASVAQVHRGALHDGQPVAIKVMRPGVEAQYRTDLVLIRLMARLALWTRPPASVDLEGFVGELVDLANEELDFRVEARHAALLRESLVADTVPHYVPQVYPACSGPRVLTLEWLEGVSANELLRAVSRGDEDGLRACAAKGAVPGQVARTLCESIIAQCFRHRLFHADPHAANVIVLGDGRIGYVDFGMIGWIDERTWRRQLRLNLSIATGDLDGAYEALLETLQPPPSKDLRRFERAFKQLLQRWIFATRLPTSSLRERSAAFFSRELFSLVRAEGMRMPSADMRLNRALLVSDILVLTLCPEMLRLPLLERFFRDELARLVSEATRDGRLLRGGYDSLFAVLDGPVALRQFSQAVRTGVAAPIREPPASPSRLERAALTTLAYVRLLVAAAVVIVVVSGVQGSSVTPSAWDAGGATSWRWIAVASGAVLLLAIGRIMRVLR